MFSTAVCTGCSQGVQGLHITGSTTCRGFPSLSTGVQHCLGCTCHCTALYCTGVVTRPGYDHCSMNGPRYAACSTAAPLAVSISLYVSVSPGITPWASSAAWRCPSPAPPCRCPGRGRGRPPPPPSAAAGGSTQTLQHGEHINMVSRVNN